MKRGLLYSCCRENGYNKLVLAQHLDDLAESFIMSALHNGQVLSYLPPPPSPFPPPPPPHPRYLFPLLFSLQYPPKSSSLFPAHLAHPPPLSPKRRVLYVLLLEHSDVETPGRCL